MSLGTNVYVTVDEFKSYCGVDNVDDLIEDISDQESYLADILAEAESDVESKVALVYKTPLPADLQVVQKWVKILARVELYDRNEHNDIPEKFKQALTVAYAQMDQLNTVPPQRTLPNADILGGDTGGSSMSIRSTASIFNDFAF
jgi:hypothetical protein